MNAQAREKIIADEITNGNYTKALDVIDNILKKKITIKAELNLLTFKAKIFFRQGKFDESYVVAQTIAEKSFKNNLPLYNIYADIFQINFFTVKNNFDPILNMILIAKEKLTKINNLSENEKKAVEAGLLYYRSHYFEYHGQYDQALENCFASYTIFKELNQFDELTSTLESLSTYYRIKGEYQKALELLDEALIVQENIKNPIHLGIINKNMGLIFAFKGDLTK